MKQVTDGHWSVKWVTSIALKPLAAEWDLVVEGAIMDTIDRGSFESCSTGQCHPATWTDDKSQEWSGTPLWLIVARADDDIKHDTGAFNRALAAAGYTVDIIAADGYTVTLDSAKLAENNSIILSNKINGNPLAEKDFPLKLVGPDLSKKEMVSGVVKVVIHFAEAPVTETTNVPSLAVGNPVGPLKIIGLVDSSLEISPELFSKQTTIQATVEHPKKGAMDVLGVPLKALLSLVTQKADAKTLSIIASDGYSADVDLAGALACENCLVTVGEDGKFNVVMPGFGSNTWVKDVITFELK
jgi:DMSO/TMAO reductase YedYZ molybdopterin-dependent catalytic subunit